MRVAALLVTTSCVLLAGCTGEHKSDGPSEAAAAELAKLHADVAAVETKLNSAKDELELVKTNVEEKQRQLQEKDRLLAVDTSRISALEAELDNLRKQDSQVFRGIGELRQRREFSKALNLYRLFIEDFPGSPLVPDAERAIDAMSKAIDAASFESADRRSQSVKQKEQELKSRLPYGAVTPEELTPFIKNKTTREISALFGNPEHVFPDGTEWGYADRVIDGKTGRREMLIITFTSGKVSAFRVGYTGRKISP